ncbi:hypothetical protein GCM10010218_10260 [Streptomyces mashuensis]|uniref:TIGR04222 domain-containing membrane protein n=1 Tax=Streptomyces mashuensis TaxID=33904 RepID=A0A919AX84_9ACTN|nr:TIGR04222 domain-containing membrane protein [Streptomyces mashuensis]GHF30888.1 hypothetical protein GCM10010218_10260 [Streptomyces mashuensis]
MTVVLVLAVLVLLGTSLWLLHESRHAHDPVVSFVKGKPGLMEIAYLRDGRERVADTVIVRMLELRRIELGPEGRVTVLDPVPDNAVERALFRSCGTDWGSTLPGLHFDLRTDAQVLALEDPLVRRGLLIPPGRMKPWRWAAGIQVASMVVTALLSLLLLGLGRAGVFASVLPWIALVLVVAGIVLRVKCHPEWIGHELTAEGRAFVGKLRDDGWDSTDPATHPAGLAGVVALHGVDAIEDEELRKQLRKAAGSVGSSFRSSAAGSAAAASSSSSSSSSSSGGSSCGTACSSCSSHSSHSCSSSSCSSCGGGGCS